MIYLVIFIIFALVVLSAVDTLLHKGQIRTINLSLLPHDSSPIIAHLTTSNDLSSGSIKALSAIETYGANRMAQKAMNVLKQMRKSNIEPAEVHYSAVIWACTNSNLYERAVSVYKEMVEYGVKRTTSTYEALAQGAEVAGDYEDTIMWLEKVNEEGLEATTDLYNSCMWAADSAAHPELALELLERMEKDGIPRDMTSYEAAIWACEKQGEGKTAEHVLELMAADNIAPNTPMLRATMWAHVKGGEQEEALRLFDSMGDSGYDIRKDSGCYNAAIWACEQTNNFQRSVQLLRLMKMEGFKRSTISFDGVLSALSHAGDHKQCNEVFKWMARDRPPVPKSPVSYKVLVDVMERHNRWDDAIEYYTMATRDGFFVPWVEGTRTIDFRSFSFSMAKIAMYSILQAMKVGTMPIFSLDIIVGDIKQLDAYATAVDPDFAAEMAFTAGTKFGVLDMDSGSAGIPQRIFDEARKSGETMYRSNCLFSVDQFASWLALLGECGLGQRIHGGPALGVSVETIVQEDEATYHVFASREALIDFLGDRED